MLTSFYFQPVNIFSGLFKILWNTLKSRNFRMFQMIMYKTFTLRKYGVNTFTRSKYGEIWSIFPYSVLMWKIRTRINSVFGHFSRSVDSWTHTHSLYAFVHLFKLSSLNSAILLLYKVFYSYSVFIKNEKWKWTRKIKQIKSNHSFRRYFFQS